VRILLIVSSITGARVAPSTDKVRGATPS
jgi:hypothetical protein